MPGLGSQLQNIATAMQGFSAGLQGQLPQFQAAQNQRIQQEQEQARYQQEQQKAMAAERQKTMFTDANAALQLVKMGNLDGVVQLGINRLQGLQQLSQQFPDIDPSDTQRVTQLAVAARNGDEEALELLTAELESAVQVGQAIGVLGVPEPTKGIEVDGQIVDPATGRVIYEGKQETPSAASPLGKLAQDFRNGFIPQDLFEAEVAKLGEDPTEAYIKGLEVQNAELDLEQRRREMGAKDAEAAKAQERQAAEREAVAAQAQFVGSLLREAHGMIDTAQPGRTGAALAFLDPVGENAQLRRKLESIKANIGFDKLMEMKRSSPTGGALGAISVQELQSLQSSLGSLDAMSSADELKGVLQDIYSVYDRINAGAGGSPLPSLAPRSIEDMSSDDLVNMLGGGSR